MVHSLVKNFVSPLIFSTLVISVTAKAEIMFEGYYKIMSGGTHAGFMIARYEFDEKKKQFKATTFMKTGELAGSLTESVKTIADQDLKPISLQYTALVGNGSKTVDGEAKTKGKDGKMHFDATVRDGKKSEKISVDLPKGTFFSNFLSYVILKSKTGLKADSNYDYKAIAEEDGKVVDGVAFVKGLEDVNGLKAHRILNEFKGSKFISYVTPKGEVLSVKAPAQNITQELVPQPSIATGQFQIPTSLVKTLFGDIPTGQVNEISKTVQAKRAEEISKTPLPTESGKPEPSKSSGVPAGKGIEVKSNDKGN